VSTALASLVVKVMRLAHGQDLDLPAYLTPGSAGMDLRAAIDTELVIEALERIAIPTGIAVALPAGFEGQVRSRSGLALRDGLAVLNAPGTVDSDYRGEIKVILVNLGRKAVTLKRGDRIAQFVVNEVEKAVWKEVQELPGSDRGDGGFGHTGR